MQEILQEIVQERLNQIEKWGHQHHDYPTWITILSEEVGEAAEQALNIHFDSQPSDKLKSELIQVAAVAVAALEQIEDEHNNNTSKQ